MPEALPRNRTKIPGRERHDQASTSSGAKADARAAFISGRRSRTRRRSTPDRGSTASWNATCGQRLSSTRYSRSPTTRATPSSCSANRFPEQCCNVGSYHPAWRGDGEADRDLKRAPHVKSMRRARLIMRATAAPPFESPARAAVRQWWWIMRIRRMHWRKYCIPCVK